MRAHFLAAALLGCAAASDAAVAGDSSAIFANSSAAAAPAQLTVTYLGGALNYNDIAAGNYDQTGVNTPDNYLSGICGSSDGCLGDDLVRRNYFSFNVTGLPSKAIAATVTIFNPDATTLPFSGFPVAPGYISDTATLPYVLSSVSSSEAAVAGSSTDAGIFADLGEGAVLGSTTVSAADDGGYVTVLLDAQALAEISGGGDITFGGSSVPEPATLALALLGLSAVAAARLSRR